MTKDYECTDWDAVTQFAEHFDAIITGAERR